MDDLTMIRKNGITAQQKLTQMNFFFVLKENEKIIC